jgi:hypothetical protein
VVLDPHYLAVIRQRSRGRPETYSIGITCRDEAGNAAAQAVGVSVPR